MLALHDRFLLTFRCTCMLACTLLVLQPASTEQLPNSKAGSSHYHISCDSRQDSDCNDQTLDQVASMVSTVQKYVYIHINTAHLKLRATAIFSGLHSLNISGSVTLNTTIVCSERDYGGLVFRNITSLTLRSLTVTNCGTKLHAAEEQREFLFSSAVSILLCKEVKVSYMIVRNNNGIGMKILNHQGGMVHIESSKFLENKLTNKSIASNHRGGGGVYVGGFEWDPSEPITIRFDNCTFQENVAHTKRYDYAYTDDLGNPISGYGSGGGAAIRLCKGLTDIHVIFSWCDFIRNTAFKGGGLASKIEGANGSSTRNISVTVGNSRFEGNGCKSSRPDVDTTVIGGGISINFASKKSMIFHSNSFTIENVVFENNCAWFGGGLYFYSDHEHSRPLNPTKLFNAVQIKNCTFEHNQAHTGSAIDITPTVFQRLLLTSGILTTPVLSNCSFIDNSITINSRTEQNQITYGIGTLYVSLYNIKFEERNQFKNNVGTPIHIVNGNIDMSQSSVHFYNNSRIQGGAIALIGQSSMVVGPNRCYSFINNTALGKGGGLYIQLDDNHAITASKTCFINYFDDDTSTITPPRDWSATILFMGNQAKAGTGHAIFATSLYPCQSINNGTINKPWFVTINSSEVFTMRNIEIDNTSELEGAQVATEGARLYRNRPSLRVVPGERFSHGVTINDDLSNKVNVALTASIMHKNDTQVEIDKAFSSCVGEEVILKGAEGQKATLHLQTITSRQSYIDLEVELVDCPPGLSLNSETYECDCDDKKYDGLIRCDTTTFRGYITPGFWTGKVVDEHNQSREELVTSYCPLNFCNYNYTATFGSEIRLPQNYNDLNKAICGESRNGTSCGTCALGYTTHFHSPIYECKHEDPTLCKFGWLFYILSELVPVTIVFISLLIFNINFTSGAVNGFIVFSQMLASLKIDASGFITPTPVVAELMKGQQFIYGLFNLDFFHVESLSFCLWYQASALDMLAFKYVTIVYILFLVILVICFMNKCHSGRKYLAKFCRFTTIKTSVIHGISAFFILCYSQCLSVSLKLLRSSNLNVKKGSNLSVSNRVWLNSDIIYFQGEHLLYALPALFCLLTVGIFPLVVLLICPLFCKILSWFGYGESKLATFITQSNTLKPLLDSLQSCFSDSLRFFAGLYFLYRWLPLSVDTLTSSYLVSFTVVEAGIIVILALHALCQPYAKRVHNIIDTLLFADLALINIITFAHYYVLRTALDRDEAINSINTTLVIQLVLIYLPLVVMMGYALVSVFRYFGCSKNYLIHSLKLSDVLPLTTVTTITGSHFDNDSDSLPHRLIADDTDYKCYEDTDHSAYIEANSPTVEVTY